MSYSEAAWAIWQDAQRYPNRVRRLRARCSANQNKRARVYARDGYRCVSCGTQENLTLDHIVPLARGGDNSFGNLQTMCFGCNNAKGDEDYAVFARRGPRVH